MKLEDIESTARLDLIDIDTKSLDQKCHICNQFVKSTDLEIHYLEQHNQKVKVEKEGVLNAKKIKGGKIITENSPCNICGKIFNSYSRVLVHTKRIHKNIKDYPCNLCDKSFFNNWEIDKHKKSVHDQIKDYVCDKCDKTFADKRSLTRHIERIHLKTDKIHQCDLCSSSFKEKKV